MHDGAINYQKGPFRRFCQAATVEIVRECFWANFFQAGVKHITSLEKFSKTMDFQRYGSGKIIRRIALSTSFCDSFDKTTTVTHANCSTKI